MKPGWRAGVAAFAFCTLAGCGRNPVGFVGTLSGPSAELGLAGRNGTQLLLERAEWRLESCDDEASSEKARECLRSLAARNVRVVVGPMVSGAATGLPELAESLGMAVISPTVSAPRFSGRADRFVKLMADNSRQSAVLASHLLQGAPAILWVLHEIRNGSYSRGVADDVARRVAADSRWTVERDSFVSGTELDFGRVLRGIDDSSRVLVVGSSMDVAVFQKERVRAGKRFVCLGSQWGMGEDLLRIAGKEAEGMVFSGMSEYAGRTSEYRAFREAYEARFGAPPSFGAAFGYEAADLALAIARRGGDPGDALDEVIAQRRIGALGWELELDSAGDSRRRPELFVVRNGGFTPLR